LEAASAHRITMTSTDQYDYELPQDLIAQHPLVMRSDARLLVVNRASESFEHAHVRDLPEFLHAGDGMVLNDSRVIPAKLIGIRTNTGGRWQGLYLGSDRQGVWRILGSTRGKLQIGETLTLLDRNARPHTKLHLLARLPEGGWAARPGSDSSVIELLEQIGRVPLPHYIREGKMVSEDVLNYQTVFSKNPGSVAAPTAGLHFTKELLQRLGNAGVSMGYVTLHVGLGTFRPISTANLEDHRMHSEWGSVPKATAELIADTRESAGRLIGVGTTCVRTLESAALAAKDSRVRAWSGETNLFIRPPFRFRAVDGLLTNFHLPKSTLLVLVRTFGGDALIRRAYEAAISEQYRFFSYGDAMLIL
jgi:S-adenosylmethionine:tRNA ribosyltransferase-isomerase